MGAFSLVPGGSLGARLGGISLWDSGGDGALAYGTLEGVEGH